MATAERPSSHREEIGRIVDAAGTPFTAVTLAITLGVPAATYGYGQVTGDPAALFYVHVALGAFWFGTDFFFKFVLGPAMEATDQEAATAVNRNLMPKMITVLEPLSLGVVAAGIGLADLQGLWSNPSVWLHVALGLGIVMLVMGFGPLHYVTTNLYTEMAAPDPDPERVEELNGWAMKLGLVQTIFMLGILVAMVGLRGLL